MNKMNNNEKKEFKNILKKTFLLLIISVGYYLFISSLRNKEINKQIILFNIIIPINFFIISIISFFNKKNRNQ